MAMRVGEEKGKLIFTEEYLLINGDGCNPVVITDAGGNPQ